VDVRDPDGFRTFRVGRYDPAMTRPSTIRVALCQLNLRVGDLEGNLDSLSRAYARADASGADLAVFPELAICGYPPEDLLLKPGFVDAVHSTLDRFATTVTGHCVAVVGWIEGHRMPGSDPHDHLDGPWNAAAVVHGGTVVGSYRKQALPNYGVFDEKRYFDSGPAGQPLYRIGGLPVAITVCEDVWVDGGPVVDAARGGAAVVININASPFHIDKQTQREQMLGRRVGESGVPIVYLNLVGGQDELVFDGGSVVMAADGDVLCRLARFVESFEVVDVEVSAATAAELPIVEVSTAVTRGSDGERPVATVVESASAPEEVWNALALGLHDYVTKNGFSEVVVGLSGGVDSSIVAALAADALGADRVHGVLMPSRYSSDHSLSDAEQLADNLGIDRRTIAIEAAHSALMDLLEPSFLGRAADLTEENLQSRIRGVLLMALSNKMGWMVLTTGNKSETAVGYSTLYGDTAGGLAVIKDVPKLLVYELCRWRNTRPGGEIIPASVLTKAPSAELRPDQRDDQSLPPYEVLDLLIEAYVDEDRTIDELIAVGHDPALVERIVGLIDRAEYKRRQSPPGIRISQKAFGRDRRVPITNAYRPY